MIPKYRDWFNNQFTPASHEAFLQKVHQAFNHVPPFRIAETPFFIPDILKNRLLEACNEINHVICSPNFKDITQGALSDPNLIVPGEDTHTTFLQMDFGICLDENGQPMPRLIEIQGFPSVYFFQEFISRIYRAHYGIPPELSSFFDPAMDEDAYKALMQKVIVGDSNPENVVMLEIEPEKQTTYIDFICTAARLAIKVLCITKVIKKGRLLFYENEEGNLVPIHRIYNRVIFDELDQRPDLHLNFNFTDDLDVYWVGHPNWFFRISKYTMPLLSGQYVPKCYYLSDLVSYPENLHDFVLKPLFSFAGAGVELNVTKELLDGIEHRGNYLLQEKVEYAPVLKSPNEPVKCEIRMLMLWSEDMEKPKIVNNLVRLSKGAMIGVKYNKDKDWVGGSVGFFEH
ncbi:MAG: hypothetical protein IPN29_10445 [Saprospiraceae bacterium]|nr:hypothetical protein [Saprospiraceae bacterium]